jgi:hypothetical protein
MEPLDEPISVGDLWRRPVPKASSLIEGLTGQRRRR